MSVAISQKMRRGACPALSAPMMTGDGLLVRLNLSEGGLSPATLTALCKAGSRHGNGLVEITARGSFQVRGLTSASAPLFADEVNALDIPVREGVPVETSPLAGLDPMEVADPIPLVRAIRAEVESAGLSHRLGPKVSVVVDAGGQISLSGVSADVRVRAVSAKHWLVSVAGMQLGIAGKAGEGVASVLALLQQIAQRGHAARGRDLPHSVLDEVCNWPISPHEGEMSGGTGGDNVGRIPLGLLKLLGGKVAIAIALPFGQCEAAALAELAAPMPGILDFRFAPGRRLLALGTAKACGALQDRARALDFITDAADARLRIAACAGASACASGHFAARDIGKQIAARLPSGYSGIVHVSGCAKGCAHPAPADHVLVGTDSGVALVHNGRAGDRPRAVFANTDAACAAILTELSGAAA